MTVEIVVYMSADTQGKEFFTYLDDQLGRREYEALAGVFRALVSMHAENKFHKLSMEAGWEWVVRLDALQAIEFRNYDDAGLRHRIDVEVCNGQTQQPDRQSCPGGNSRRRRDSGNDCGLAQQNFGRGLLFSPQKPIGVPTGPPRTGGQDSGITVILV